MSSHRTPTPESELATLQLEVRIHARGIAVLAALWCGARTTRAHIVDTAHDSHPDRAALAAEDAIGAMALDAARVTTTSPESTWPAVGRAISGGAIVIVPGIDRLERVEPTQAQRDWPPAILEALGGNDA